MKTEITDIGWRETTAKNIVVEYYGTKPLMTVDQWVDFNERFPQIGRKRKTCKCCKKRWTDLTGNVNIVFTTCGSKAVCDDCFRELSLKKKHDVPLEK